MRKSNSILFAHVHEIACLIADRLGCTVPKTLPLIGRHESNWSDYKKNNAAPEVVKWALMGYLSSLDRKPSPAQRALDLTPDYSTKSAATGNMTKARDNTEANTLAIALALLVASPNHSTYHGAAMQLIKKGTTQI